MAPEKVSIQLHTVEGVSREIPSLLVFAKCGTEQRRFPLATRRAITDAFFWKSAVIFKWNSDLAVEWLVYGFDGRTDIPLGRCRFPLKSLMECRKQAAESKKLKLLDDPSITICFSAESLPRPLLPDGSIASSVLKLPDFLLDVDSDAPLFNHDRLYGMSIAPTVPSIWAGLASPDSSSKPTTPSQGVSQEGASSKPVTFATSSGQRTPYSNYTAATQPLSDDIPPPVRNPYEVRQPGACYGPAEGLYPEVISEHDIYCASIKRTDSLPQRPIKELAGRVRRKLEVLLHRGDSDEEDDFPTETTEPRYGPPEAYVDSGVPLTATRFPEVRRERRASMDSEEGRPAMSPKMDSQENRPLRKQVSNARERLVGAARQITSRAQRECQARHWEILK